MTVSEPPHAPLQKKPNKQEKTYNHVQNHFGCVNSIRLIFLGGTIYLVALRQWQRRLNLWLIFYDGVKYTDRFA